MATKTKYLKDARIFKESDGKWCAVIVDERGTRRNIAPPNCATKSEAKQAVREWLSYGW